MPVQKESCFRQFTELWIIILFFLFIFFLGTTCKDESFTVRQRTSIRKIQRFNFDFCCWVLKKYIIWVKGNTLKIRCRWRGRDAKKVKKRCPRATKHLLTITHSNLTSISDLALEIVFQIIISSSVLDGLAVPNKGVSADLPRASITRTILLSLLTVSNGRDASLYYKTVSDGRAH